MKLNPIAQLVNATPGNGKAKASEDGQDAAAAGVFAELFAALQQTPINAMPSVAGIASASTSTTAASAAPVAHAALTQQVMNALPEQLQQQLRQQTTSTTTESLAGQTAANGNLQEAVAPTTQALAKQQAIAKGAEPIKVDSPTTIAPITAPDATKSSQPVMRTPETTAPDVKVTQVTPLTPANAEQLKTAPTPPPMTTQPMPGQTPQVQQAVLPTQITVQMVEKPVITTTASNDVLPITPSANATVTATATPSAQPTAAAPQLGAQVGTQAWQNQLQQHMVQMVAHNQQEVTLRLHPTELGPLQMQLQLDDKAAQLAILTHSSQVRGALESALPQLRDALASQGIQLTDSNVGQDTQFGQNTQQFGQQHKGFAGRADNGSNGTLASGDQAEAESSADVGSAQETPLSGRLGQVDTFA